MPTIRIPNGWSPRRYQSSIWNFLERGGKRALAIWHRRAGKDDIGLHWAAVSALSRIGTYWHMLPEAEQARKAIWRAVDPHRGARRIDIAFPKEIRARTRDQEMNIEFRNGSIWQVVGSDNFNSLVGSPPIGVVFSEWPLADPQAWAFLSPILEENGGWAIFNGTPRGPNHGKRLFEFARRQPDWFCEKLTAHETGIFSAEQLKRIKRDYEGTFGPDAGGALFEQEYECSFEAAVLGAYYGRLMADAERERRVIGVPYDPNALVWTAWDLGISDATAIWFAQVVGREIHLIDYYESSGVELAHYAHVVRDKKYVYGGHLVPHDAKARELGTGKTRLETLAALGLGSTIVPVHSVADGINAARSILPKCWFDLEKTTRGVEALKLYRANYDEKGQTLRERPVHDWASHGADAFRCLAMGLEQAAHVRPKKPSARRAQGQGGWMGG
jgi:phage terminase large subunit